MQREEVFNVQQMIKPGTRLRPKADLVVALSQPDRFTEQPTDRPSDLPSFSSRYGKGREEETEDD